MHARLIGPLRIFIGYDPREAVAYHTLCHSLLEHASVPLAITPLKREALSVYQRPTGTESTAFAFTRFLVPWLSGYQGVSVFMDCDMLVTTDILDAVRPALEDGANRYPKKAAWCCQHDYTPRDNVKMFGATNAAYPRKNWSSFLVFQNSQCQTLTPSYVNEASAADLHRLAWTEDDRIGALPLSWNYLVGEDGQSPDPPKNIHWTLGGPYLAGYEDAPLADVWRDAHRKAMGL